MVDTRLQRTKRLLAMAESHSGSSRSPVDTTLELMQKLVERLEYIEDNFGTKIDLVVEEQKAFSKDVEASRDQGLMEIMDLNKSLDEAKDEIAVLKKAVRHGSGGGVPHVKVKEPDSFDGIRSAKTLGNFLWDMEQYFERLGLSDDETKVEVAAQFLTKDAKMWWRRRMD
eukprot:PITA_09588